MEEEALSGLNSPDTSEAEQLPLRFKAACLGCGSKLPSGLRLTDRQTKLKGGLWPLRCDGVVCVAASYCVWEAVADTSAVGEETLQRRRGSISLLLSGARALLLHSVAGYLCLYRRCEARLGKAGACQAI